VRHCQDRTRLGTVTSCWFPPDPVQVALRFNECITAGDIDALPELMNNDHTFVDTEGEKISGRGACPGCLAWFLRRVSGLSQHLHLGDDQRRKCCHDRPLDRLRPSPDWSSVMVGDHSWRSGRTMAGLARHPGQ
jgi:hypothetical protein